MVKVWLKKKIVIFLETFKENFKTALFQAF